MHDGGLDIRYEEGVPDIMIVVHKLDPEAMASYVNTEEVARSYAEKHNLTLRMVDDIAVFSYGSMECILWNESIGTVFYVDDLIYDIMRIVICAIGFWYNSVNLNNQMLGVYGRITVYYNKIKGTGI